MNFEPTNHPIENELPKLVRDNIPELYQKRTGKMANIKFAENDKEYLEFLVKKIAEEAMEVKYSLEHNNLQEELADVYEVIDAILELKNWTQEDVKKVQALKREKNGGFEKRIILKSK